MYCFTLVCFIFCFACLLLLLLLWVCLVFFAGVFVCFVVVFCLFFSVFFCGEVRGGSVCFFSQFLLSELNTANFYCFQWV